jgi:glycosyltransferase involved in cell wall biosynthesis
MKISMSSFYFVKHGEGISRYIEELQRYLQVKNIVCYFSAPKFSTYSRLIYPIAAARFLMRFSRSRNAYDLNHVHLPIPSLTPFFSKVLRAPGNSIFQIWNPPYDSTEVFDLAQYLTNSQKLAKFGLKNLSSPVVVSSRYMQKTLAAACGANSGFIPAAIDTQRFSFSSHFGERHETDDPLILYCGHLTKWKGVENLIKAMPLIIEEQPNTTLRIMSTGHGRSYGPILQMIRRLGIHKKVILRNCLYQQIEHAFEKADVGILPLLSPIATASPPRTLLEMMSKGLPVVATKIGGVSEIVKHKETGILVDSSPENIAEGILTLLFNESLRRRISVTAREYIEAHHAWENVGPLYVKLYEECT